MAALEPEWTLGDFIAKARRMAELDQADIANACGVSRALVSRWERDQSEPTARQLRQIAEVTRAQYLLDPQNWKILTGADLCLISNPAPPLPLDWSGTSATDPLLTLCSSNAE